MLETRNKPNTKTLPKIALTQTLKNEKIRKMGKLDIHLWFKRDFTTPFKNIVFNKKEREFNYERYTLIKLENSFFIFDLYDYKSYPISEELNSQIKQNRFSEIESDLRIELKKKNILI